MGEIINVTAPPPDQPIWNHFAEAVKKLRWFNGLILY
jgi:hypothetical protein